MARAKNENKKSLNLYKIGRAQSEKRIDTYITENPHGIELLKFVKVKDYVGTESFLLKKYSAKQYKGEWFKFNDKEKSEIMSYLERVGI